MSSKGEPIVVKDGVALRPIDVSDLESLREWKNANRERFFHRREITTVQQDEWYLSFQNRTDDYMFMVELDGVRVGCMGYRVDGDDIDFYNIIRGRTDIGAGLMHEALGRLVAEARFRYPGRRGRVLVVADNPAISWYRKCGFRELVTEHRYVLMEWITDSH